MPGCPPGSEPACLGTAQRRQDPAARAPPGPAHAHSGRALGGSGAHPGTSSGKEAEPGLSFPSRSAGCPRCWGGWLEPRGLQPASPRPRVPSLGAEGGSQGTASCLRAHTLPLRIHAGRPPARAPRLLGRQPPLTHTLVTLFRPDTVTHRPACWEESSPRGSQAGRAHEKRWVRSSLCKGPGVRVRGGTGLQTRGTGAGPIQASACGCSHTCPGDRKSVV